MFADDTAGLASGDNLPELFNFVNIEIKKIARWFRANKMAFNVGKTKYIISQGAKLLITTSNFFMTIMNLTITMKT
jgi:hypothetical protein